MQRVQGDNVDILREVLIKGFSFWSLDGGLAGYDSTWACSCKHKKLLRELFERVGTTHVLSYRDHKWQRHGR